MSKPAASISILATASFSKIYANLVPAKTVGGDFYEFIPLGEDSIAVAIGDVADKGVPGDDRQDAGSVRLSDMRGSIQGRQRTSEPSAAV